MKISTEHTKWLTKRRDQARELADELLLPTTKTRGWEFTDLTEFELDSFTPPDGGDSAALSKVTPLFTPQPQSLLLDQVNHLSPHTTHGLPSTPKQPIVTSLEMAIQQYPQLVQKHFGQIVSTHDFFVAHNERDWSGGAFIYIPTGVTVDDPIVLKTIQAGSKTSLNWRVLIVLEENAKAEVWEQYLSTEDQNEGLFNAVVELSVGESSQLRYVCAQNLNEKSWIFSTQRAEVGRDGTLDWVALGFGSARGKVRMETQLKGEGASAKVTGAYAGQNRQHLDFDTTQEHAAAHTNSDLAFRGILQDRATAVWRGMICVDPGAQQTDAFQESRNLLLSKRAHADAIPGLEIEANDVRCTHAAAVAQVDKEQLYYLMSRGLPHDIATRLIIDGFMQELVERFAQGPIQAALTGALEQRLEELLGTRD
jgi:Fe-S cluster assembly protein SufD